MTKTLSRTFTATIQSSAGPAWLSAMVDKRWAAIAVSGTIDAVKPNPPPDGTAVVNGPIGAWGGGVYNSTLQELQVPCQGGHGDYSGSETYGLLLNVTTPAWARVANTRYAFGSEPYMDDGSPRCSHSMCQLAYAANVDRTFITSMPFIAANGNSYKNAFAFNRATNTWLERAARLPGWGADGSGDVFGCSEYDPVTGKIFCVMTNTTNGSIEAYDPVANTGQLFNGFMPHSYEAVSALSPERRIMIVMGGVNVSSTTTRYFNLDNPAAGWTLISTTGTAPSGRIGIDWHAPSGGFIARGGSGVNLFKLTPPTPLAASGWVWSTITPDAGNTVTPTSSSPLGYYGRFRIAKNIGGSGRDVVIFVNHTQEATYVYKLPLAGV